MIARGIVSIVVLKRAPGIRTWVSQEQGIRDDQQAASFISGRNSDAGVLALDHRRMRRDVFLRRRRLLRHDVVDGTHRSSKHGFLNNCYERFSLLSFRPRGA